MKNKVRANPSVQHMKTRAPIPSLPTEAETNDSSVDLVDQVRCRAYELYQERGKEDGHEVDDWLRAELEVTQRSNKAAAA